jgi:WD40 repeat protein
VFYVQTCIVMTVLEGALSEGVQKDLIREDTEKLQCILQFLHSRGLAKTAAQLETEADISFRDLEEGNILDSLLDQYFCNQQPSVAPSTCVSPLPLPGTSITDIFRSFNDVHGSANPTCVRWHPEETALVVTGGADRRVIFRNVETGDIVFEVQLASPVLSMDWQCPGFLVAGCMGGEIYSIDSRSKNVRLVGKPHGTSRVLNIQSSGGVVASMAKDSCVNCFRLDGVICVPPLRFEKDVSSICWIDNNTIVVSEIDNPIVSIWRLSSDTKWMQVSQLCMNLSQFDPRTPYTALAMCWNSQHRLLAACTNRNSVILFHLPDILRSDQMLCPIKTLYGMSAGVYDTPAVEFSKDGSHLYVTSDKRLLVFEIRSGHRIIAFDISDSKAVRSMHRHPLSDLVATVSFDRRLSILD